MTRVSVAIPVYNGEKYLRPAIESVLAQDFDDFELIICDNASKDTTPQICAAYRDPRLRYLRFDELVPAGANWNRCLTAGRAEYVVLLHADDVLRPSFLRKTVALLDANPDVGLVHCTVQHIDRLGNDLLVQRLHERDQIDRERRTFEELLVAGCVINPSGVIVRRSVYDAVGPFTSEVVWGIDWHMWLRIAMQTSVAYLAEILAMYREHAQSGTSDVLPSGRNATDELWVLRDVLARMEATNAADARRLRARAMRQLGHRTWCFAELMVRAGHRVPARKNLVRAARISPRLLFTFRFWGLLFGTYFGYEWFDRMHHLVHFGGWRNQKTSS